MKVWKKGFWLEKKILSVVGRFFFFFLTSLVDPKFMPCLVLFLGGLELSSPSLVFELISTAPVLELFDSERNSLVPMRNLQ